MHNIETLFAIEDTLLLLYLYEQTVTEVVFTPSDLQKGIDGDSAQTVEMCVY